ncbi:hypothetical protein AGOR_G00138050 [Albula goreensis]|uniref:Uncharacterized protein n=1 Tax=Albula goreensis TaxID=1534307 RepID=A0A8T3DBB5_9TELE|nr:hypothetical protein AGOR_G00138050 [Albula goreensis]
MEPSKEKYTPVYCDNTHNSVFRAGPVKGRASGGEGPAKTHCPQRLWAEQIMPDLIENNTEVLAFQEGMDELLSRLDEFCTILDTFRSQSSELLWHQVPLVLAKAAAMRSVYSRIDKFEAFVQMVKDCVCSLELQVLEVERTQKGFPCSLHGILRPFQRSPSDSQKEEMLHPFELPTLFRTEECFHQKS